MPSLHPVKNLIRLFLQILYFFILKCVQFLLRVRKAESLRLRRIKRGSRDGFPFFIFCL